jgi:hypothetical protein
MQGPVGFFAGQSYSTGNVEVPGQHRAIGAIGNHALSGLVDGEGKGNARTCLQLAEEAKVRQAPEQNTAVVSPAARIPAPVAIAATLPPACRSWRTAARYASGVTATVLSAPPPPDSKDSSVYALFGKIREELWSMPPTSTLVGEAQSIELQSLRLFNAHLRPFLAKWHAELTPWEQQNPGKTEAKWPEAEACRAELEQLRAEIRADVIKLGKAIGLLQAIECSARKPVTRAPQTGNPAFFSLAERGRS